MSDIPSILLVEDDDVDTYLVREMLTAALGEDYRLVDVKYVGQAREKLELETFDVVFLDLHLPDGSGVSLVETLVDANIPIVAMSGNENEKLRAACLEAGACGFFSKIGVTPNVVIGALREARTRRSGI